MRKFACFSIALVFGAPSALAQSQPEIENPYAEYYATVVRVIDGDTLEVRVDLWPGLVAEYSVRVRDIDTPELRGADCPQEKRWAEEAKAQVEKLYPIGTTVKLEAVAIDAYSSRVLADVRRFVSDRWKYLAEELIGRDMAMPWTTDMEKIEWCKLSKPFSGPASFGK